MWYSQNVDLTRRWAAAACHAKYVGVCAQRGKHCTIVNCTYVEEAETYASVAIGMAYRDFEL